MRRRSLTTTMLVGLMALLIGACDATGGDDTTTTALETSTSTSDMTTTTGSEMTTTTSDATTTTVMVDPVGEFMDGTFASNGFPGTGDAAFLTDVSIALTPEEFDRVVFEFSTDTEELTYQIEPIEQRQIETGEQEFVGEVFYEVTLTPASGTDLSGEQPEEVYTGPERLTPEIQPSSITEVVLVEDFENVMSWVVGLDSSSSFAHSLSMDDSRLIVDFEA